jgi:hypothetical protein
MDETNNPDPDDPDPDNGPFRLTEEEVDRLLAFVVETEPDLYDPPPPEVVLAYVQRKATRAERQAVRKALAESRRFRRELLDLIRALRADAASQDTGQESPESPVERATAVPGRSAVERGPGLFQPLLGMIRNSWRLSRFDFAPLLTRSAERREARAEPEPVAVPVQPHAIGAAMAEFRRRITCKDETLIVLEPAPPAFSIPPGGHESFSSVVLHGQDGSPRLRLWYDLCGMAAGMAAGPSDLCLWALTQSPLVLYEAPFAVDPPPAVPRFAVHVASPADPSEMIFFALTFRSGDGYMVAAEIGRDLPE